MKMFLTLSIALGLSGCASMGFTYDKEKLIETVSFDLNCPKEKIQIDSADDDTFQATGRFSLKACGKQVKYKRLGTLYVNAEKDLKLH